MKSALTLIKPIASLKLERYPASQDKSLRPWNAADELLIEHINDYLNESFANRQSAIKSLNCLLINDQFGALSTSLNDLSPSFWTDSHLSQRAIEQNLSTNCNGSIQAKPLQIDYDCLKGGQVKAQITSSRPFDLVIIRVPKHNSLLEFQLQQIIPFLKVDSKIVAAGMTKEIHNSNIQLFEKIIGQTQTSLAKKKARLIFSTFDNKPQLDIQSAHYPIKDHSITVFGLPGVFSRNSLDIGTRVLFKHLPKIGGKKQIIDLGCGNGVIGAVIAKQNPDCQLTLTDESRLAIESAKLTFSQNRLSNGNFIQTDALDGIPADQFDFVFCNPPFHQQNVQTLTIAKKMFRQSARCLNAKGELYVVANRHLKYLPVLKLYFHQVKSISSDSQFTVWHATSVKKPAA